MNRDRDRLGDILERLDWLLEARSRDKEDFLDDHWFQGGVINDFMVIGEAVKGISAELQQRAQDVPWKEMANFRDILIHQYGNIDLHQVWGIVQEQVPAAKEGVATLMQKEGWV